MLAEHGHLRPRADPGARRPRVGLPAAHPRRRPCTAVAEPTHADAATGRRSRMRLLRVELSRFFSRRAVVLLLLAAALLTALLAAPRLGHPPVSADDLAAAQAQVEEQIAPAGLPARPADLPRQPRGLLRPGAHAADCDGNLVPQPEWYLDRRRSRPRRGAAATRGIAVVVLVAALMIIVGTTFAGADWATGSMSNQLLFEPRGCGCGRPRRWPSLLGCGRGRRASWSPGSGSRSALVARRPRTSPPTGAVLRADRAGWPRAASRWPRAAASAASR